MPKLHLGVYTDLKGAETDPRRFIHVIAGHAILQNDMIAIVDLREYVKNECAVKSTDDIIMLDHILQWMEGKSFTKEYWENLTKDNLIVRSTVGLRIEHKTYSKDLEYEHVYCDLSALCKVIRDNVNLPATTVDKIGLDAKNLALLNKLFETDMKPDCFVFDMCGRHKPVKFTAQKKTYIFGLLPTNYKAASEITAFLNVSTFKEQFTGYMNFNNMN